MIVPRNLALSIIAVLFILLASCSDDNPTCPGPGPLVASTYPAGGAIDFPTDSSLTVTFNRAMDSASISAGSITLVGPAGLVAATVTFDGDSTATITPLELLDGHAVYTAHVDAGVRDSDGIQMGVPFAWSFTSGATQLLVYADIEYTISDSTGDGVADEIVAGGPPGRYLQTGVDGQNVTRAVLEFSLAEIMHDSVLEAIALLTFSSGGDTLSTYRIEAWGLNANGEADLTDWDNGSRVLALNDIDLPEGQTIAFPMTDVINFALDNSTTHVGLRIVVTGGPSVTIHSISNRPRLAIAY